MDLTIHWLGGSQDPMKPTFPVVDEDLPAVLQGARDGEPWAFDALYRTSANSVRAYARARGASDPDDLANLILYEAFRGLERFSGEAADWRSWLFRIARNKIVDDHRRRSRRPVSSAEPVNDDHISPILDPADQVVDRIDSQRAFKLLASLTPDQRDVVALRFIADLSLAETATAIDKPLTATKALQRRALRALRRNLSSQEVSQ